MHRFRDMTTYWSKIAEKTQHTLIWHVPLGWLLANFSTSHISQKLESWGYQTVYISRSCFRYARHNTGMWQSDGQTDGRTDRHVDVAKTTLAHHRTGKNIVYCMNCSNISGIDCRFADDEKCLFQVACCTSCELSQWRLFEMWLVCCSQSICW